MSESEYVKSVDEYMSNFIHKIESDLGHMKSFLKQLKSKFDEGGNFDDGDFLRIDSCYSVNDPNDLNDDDGAKYGQNNDDGDLLYDGQNDDDQKNPKMYSRSSRDLISSSRVINNYQNQRPGPASTKKKFKMTSSGQGQGQLGHSTQDQDTNFNKPLFCPAPNCRKQETNHLRMRIHIANSHKHLDDPNYPLWRCEECDWIGLFKTSLKDHMTKRHNKELHDQNDNNNSSLYLTGARKKTSSFTANKSGPPTTYSRQFYSADNSDNSSNATTNEVKRGRGRPLGTTKKKILEKKRAGKLPNFQKFYLPKPEKTIVPAVVLGQGEKRGRGRPRINFNNQTPAATNTNLSPQNVHDNLEIDRPKSSISDIATALIVRRNENDSTYINSNVNINANINEMDDLKTNFVTPTEIMIKSEPEFGSEECQILENREGQQGQGVLLHDYENENEFQMGNEPENIEIIQESGSESPPTSPSIICDTTNTNANIIADNYDDSQIN